MKIYVITVGDYSDYHICAVALSKEKAEDLRERYSDKWNEAQIEEYDTDDYYIEKGRFYHVQAGKRTFIGVREIGVVESCDRNRVFVTHYRNDRMFYNVYVKAMDEVHAKKIGMDLIAKFKAERQEL